MVWHFFKKDFRLLWPLALALAATQALCAMRTMVLGHFKEPAALDQLTRFLPVLAFLGVVLVTINVVHQDPLPGDRQDWLTRPVRRRDVWLSKVLFVLLLVLTPIFAIDVLEELSVQLPLTMSIGGAASRAVLLLGIFVVPALVLGSLTRSFTEALFLGIVAAVVLSTLDILGPLSVPPEMLFSPRPGTEWIQLACALLVAMVASAGILWFQHTYRRTGIARAMALVGALVTAATLLALPATTALRIQRWTWGRTPDPAITVDFAPDSHLTPAESGATLAIQNDPGLRDPAAVAAQRAFVQAQKSRYATILLPLRIQGLAPGSILQTDELRVRITEADGTVHFDNSVICVRSGVYVGANCRMNSVEVRASGSKAPDALATARVGLPATLYQRMKDRAVNMQLSFSLTSFAPDAPQLTGTSSSVHQVSQLGSCATRIDADGDEVELRCLTSAKTPSCIAATLEDPQTDERNPELRGCFPDYAPFRLQPSMDVVNQVGISLPFRDPTGLAQFPVNATAIARAQVRLTTYTPVSHFRRELSIRNVRLSDWEASRVLSPDAEGGQ